MEWLTQIFETIRNYPLESIGGFVTTSVGVPFITKGVMEFFNWIFKRNKKLINKITENVNVGIDGVKTIIMPKIEELNTKYNELVSDITELKNLVKNIPTNNSSVELIAYINAVTNSSSDLAVKYQKEIKKLKPVVVETYQEVKPVIEEVIVESNNDIVEHIEKVEKKVRRKAKKIINQITDATTTTNA